MQASFTIVTYDHQNIFIIQATVKFLIPTMRDQTDIILMERHIQKTINKCMNSNIHSYLETSAGQSSKPYLYVVHFLNTRAD